MSAKDFNIFPETALPLAAVRPGVSPVPAGRSDRPSAAAASARLSQTKRARHNLPLIYPAWLGLAELLLDQGQFAEVAVILNHLEAGGNV
jgi:hypothetical protein